MSLQNAIYFVENTSQLDIVCIQKSAFNKMYAVKNHNEIYGLEVIKSDLITEKIDVNFLYNE